MLFSMTVLVLGFALWTAGSWIGRWLSPPGGAARRHARAWSNTTLLAALVGVLAILYALYLVSPGR